VSDNPFIRKAERRKRQYDLAKRNYDELAKLLRRFTDADDPATRERIRKRVAEARSVVESFSTT
jgi:hypothetical protein